MHMLSFLLECTAHMRIKYMRCGWYLPKADKSILHLMWFYIMNIFVNCCPNLSNKNCVKKNSYLWNPYKVLGPYCVLLLHEKSFQPYSKKQFRCWVSCTCPTNKYENNYFCVEKISIYTHAPFRDWEIIQQL